MSRHYSFFPSRVKARREQFASTRKSVSENWDQSFCDEDSKMPSFPDLPSPTIGAEEDIPDRLSRIAVVQTGESPAGPPVPPRLGHQVNIISQSSVSTTDVYRHRDSSSGGEYEPSPRSSADPAVPPCFWSRDVAIQCAIPAFSTAAQLSSRPGLCHENQSTSSSATSSWAKGKLRGCRRSKSFDWSYLPQWANKPWEPFHNFPFLHPISIPSKSTIRAHLLAPSSADPVTATLLIPDGTATEILLQRNVSRRRETIPLQLPIPFPLSLTNQTFIQIQTPPQQFQQPQSAEAENVRSSSRSQSIVCEHCSMILQFTSHSQTEETQTESDDLTKADGKGQGESKAGGKPTTATIGTNTTIFVCQKHQQTLKEHPIEVEVTEIKKAPPAASVDKCSQPPQTSHSRPPRPTLGFNLPIPQLGTSCSSSSGSGTGGGGKTGTASGGPSGHRQSKDSGVHRGSSDSGSIFIPGQHRSSKDSGSSHRGSKDSGHAATSSSLASDGRSKASTLPTIDSKQISAIRNAEKRRRFFARKQTNSAPDSFDHHSIYNATHNVINTTRRLCGNCKEPVTNCLDGVLRATRRAKLDTTSITPTVEVWESEIRTARCGDVAVTHVSELDFPDADPPCHFCCEQASTAIHDESRLQIVSGGLVRSRDGSTRSGSAPYINLPSPNVQAENGQAAFGSLDLSPSMSQTLSPGSHHGHPVLHHHHHHHGQTAQSRGSVTSAGGGCDLKEREEEDPLVGPPASSLTRRPALVPPKLIPDPDYENDADRDRNCRNSDDSTSPRTRRSSIVVIPPMQICPGDLLVYGKVLSQRKSLLGTTIESPSPVTSMFEQEQTPARKGKNTWSLMKLFERGSRSKGCATGTLEEIMNLLQPCDFSDPKLTRFKGMCWSDFVSHVCNQKSKKSESSYSVASGSSSEGSQSPRASTSTAPEDPAVPSTKAKDSADITTIIVTAAVTTPATSTTSASATTTSSSPTSSPSKTKKGEEKKEVSKPLMRKRMGLMRTMSDRCLERRITPALWRVNPGFLLGEKLVEGKEPESGGGESSSGVGLSTSAVAGKSGKKGDGADGGNGKKPVPLNAINSEKDVANEKGGTKENPAVPPEESITSDSEPRQKMRQKEALWDLFQSECSFLYDHLMVLKNVFMEPLKRIQVEGFAMYAEPELLFGNLDELCAVTYGFCKEFIHLLLKLTDAMGDLSTTEVLAKLFEPSSKARTMSQSYHRYALNYINALNYLETLRRHSEFCDFEKLCMRDPRCKKLQLTDLLVSPVQHIMKVPLILKDIQSRTNEPQEKELIVQILEIQENSIRELDDKMRWLKNFERLLEIQRNIVWPSILEMEPKTWVPDFLRVALARQPCDSLVVSPRRQIIHEGLLQLWDTGKPTETYVILFDDMLLITRRKKGLSKKKSSLTENWSTTCGKNSGVVGSGLETNHRYIVYRQPISLDRFFIHDIGEAENTTAKLDFAFVLVSLNRFQQIVSVHTFQAPSDQVKGLWLLKMKTTQDKWKRTLQNTVFRGVRSSTDSGQSNVASSIVLGSLASKAFMRHET